MALRVGLGMKLCCNIINALDSSGSRTLSCSRCLSCFGYWYLIFSQSNRVGTSKQVDRTFNYVFYDFTSENAVDLVVITDPREETLS